MPESKTSPRRLASAERQRKALELRAIGMTYEAIADQVGYKSRQAAFDAIDRALKKMLREPAEQARNLDLKRLDAMTLALWSQARQGNQGAIDRLLRIMERRAKLLGLDAPTKVAPTTPDGTREYQEMDDEQVARRIQAILALAETCESPQEEVTDG
jgi:hypothetical protein